MSAISKFARRYDREFKEKAVTLVLGGRPQSEVARDLGVSTCSLWEWIKRAQAGQPATAPATVEAESPAAREMRRLRQEVEHLREQRDILKKALGILSAEVPLNASR